MPESILFKTIKMTQMKNHSTTTYAAILLFAAICSTPVFAAPLRTVETLTLIDIDGTKITFTEQELREMKQITEEKCIWVGESKGFIGIFDCSGALLTEALKYARKTEAAGDYLHENTYVIFRGTDEYQIICSWTELMRNGDGRRAMIMLEKEGEPLADDEGKFRVFFPGDKYVGRSVKCLDTTEFRCAEGFVAKKKDDPAATEE